MNSGIFPREYLVTWTGFQTRYGYNPARALILKQIKVWLAHMRDVGCLSVYIDGSFICIKETPGDYDACWDATGVDINLVSETLLDLTKQGRLAIKQKFGGDIRPDMVCPPGSIRPFLTFFQRDRDGNHKGIIRFGLRNFKP